MALAVVDHPVLSRTQGLFLGLRAGNGQLRQDSSAASGPTWRPGSQAGAASVSHTRRDAGNDAGWNQHRHGDDYHHRHADVHSRLRGTRRSDFGAGVYAFSADLWRNRAEEHLPAEIRLDRHQDHLWSALLLVRVLSGDLHLQPRCPRCRTYVRGRVVRAKRLHHQGRVACTARSLGNSGRRWRRHQQAAHSAHLPLCRDHDRRGHDASRRGHRLQRASWDR